MKKSKNNNNKEKVKTASWNPKKAKMEKISLKSKNYPRNIEKYVCFKGDGLKDR